jgi:hypothetical protein
MSPAIPLPASFLSSSGTTIFVLKITLHLADIPGQTVYDAIGDGKLGLDTIARNRLESLAITVLPPGPSANPFDPSVRMLRCVYCC